MLYPHYLNVKSSNQEISTRGKGEGVIRKPLQREHGAWGLLLQPFAAGMMIAGTWTWFYLPALGLALFGFLLREPLLVLVRQKYIWRRETEETRVASRWTVGMATGAALCAGALAWVYPPMILVALLAGGMVMTAVAIGLSLKNLQRSMALQIVSAVGLSSTGWLAVLAAGKQGSPQAWILWVVLSAHAVAAILIVHARLEMKSHKESARKTLGLAIGLQAVAIIAAVGLCWIASPLWIPVGFSALVNLMELRRLRNPQSLSEPLKQLGLRLLGASVAHTIVTVGSLLVKHLNF